LSFKLLYLPGLQLILGLELLVVILTSGQHSVASLRLCLGIPPVLADLLQVLF
jgi:hypothetical protein